MLITFMILCLESTRPKIYFVFPFMDHDLAGLIDNKDVELTPAVVKCYFKQLLKGVRYLHFNNFIHRDLKRKFFSRGRVQIHIFLISGKSFVKRRCS